MDENIEDGQGNQLEGPKTSAEAMFGLFGAPLDGGVGVKPSSDQPMIPETEGKTDPIEVSQEVGEEKEGKGEVRIESDEETEAEIDDEDDEEEEEEDLTAKDLEDDLEQVMNEDSELAKNKADQRTEEDKTEQEHDDQMRISSGESKAKTLRSKGKGKEKTGEGTDIVDQISSMKLTLLSEMSALLDKGFSKASKATSELQLEQKKTTAAIKDAKKAVQQLETKITSIDERLSKTEEGLNHLQKLFEEAQRDAKSMKEEIKLLKEQAALRTEKGMQDDSFGATHSEKRQTAVDRDRYIVGRWPWIPQKALRKQLDKILADANRNRSGDDLFEFENVDISAPRASYAFIKFKASANRSSQDFGYEFRKYLLNSNYTPIGADSGKIWTSQCRPEHERATRSVLNTGRAFCHSLREECGLGKYYSFLDEETEVIAGSYKDSKESITWKGQLIATLTLIEGVKSIHWTDRAASILAPDFAAKGLTLDEDSFRQKWRAFLQEAESRKTKQA